MSKRYELEVNLHKKIYGQEDRGNHKAFYYQEFCNLYDLLDDTGLREEDFEYFNDDFYVNCYLAEKVCDIDLRRAIESEIKEWENGDKELYTASYKLNVFELTPCKL